MTMVQKSKRLVSLVKDLKQSRDTWHIEISIIRLLGTRIHVSVESSLFKKYENDLAEGQAKVVHLFKVNDVGGDYRTSTHRFKINFLQTTVISDADDFPSEVPEKYFAHYNDIISGKRVKTYLVDIIGQIVNFGAPEDIIIKGKDNTKLMIELLDQNNKSIMIICVIRFASIKEWKGAYSVSSG
ncbi:hypothetical protein N665_0349s0019 [Sinapis alba]|nr:hypothetical protein N665_0349s0019 [Sinapis alba]